MGTVDGERSGVMLVGYHGKRFFVTRNLKPSSREFYWEGSEIRLRAEKAIAEEIQNGMGIDPNLFDEFVVVPQGELANIIDLDDSKRTDTMQKLVGLQKYAKIHAWLGTYLTNNKVNILSDDPAAIEASIASLRKQRQDHTNLLTEVFRADEDKLKQATAITGMYSLSSDLQTKLINKRASVAARQLSLPTSISIVEEMAKGLESKRAAVEIAAKSHADCNELLLACSNYVARTRIEQELQRMEVMALPPPPLPDYMPIGSSQEATMHSEGQRLQLLLHFKKLADSGQKVCANCARPFDQEFMAPLQELPALQEKCRLLHDANRRSRDYDNAVLIAQQGKKSFDEYSPAMLAQLAQIPITAPPTQSQGVLKASTDAALASLQVAQNAVRATEASVAQARALLASEESLLAQDLSDLDSLVVQAAACTPISDSDYSWATKLLADHNLAREQEARLQGSISVIDSQLPLLEVNLKKAIEARQKMAKVLEIRASIDTAREVLQRDQLPFELAKSSMLAIAAKMNETLEAFGAHYRVSAGAGSSFQATFFNNHSKGSQPDDRLSGGERAQFGLALRVASHSIWAQELGFLALDEPTYGFGPNDMRCVKIAIEKLRELSNDQGLQVIVVTHEKSLVPLFDNVISME